MLIRESLPLLKQIWTVSSVFLFNVGCGMMTDQTTLNLTNIQTNSSTKADSITSWTGSKEFVIIILGLLYTALLMHCFGRRVAFIMNVFASIISCCTIYFATTVQITTLGRMFTDFARPGAILGAIAIGEYTSPIYRGVFLTLASASLEFGRMTAYFIGNYKIIAILAFVLNILSLVVACTWDESPYFLAFRCKYDNCKKSFIMLRGTSFNERQELANLIQKVKQDESKIKKKMGMLETLSDVVKKVTTMKLLKPIVLLFLASILLGASGKNIYDTYSSQIICDILGKYSSFYILALQFIAPISMTFSSILIKVLKRRALLFHTGSASATLSFVISFTLFLISTTVISLTSFVPIALLLFLMLKNLCCSTIFLIWCGELFPLEHKSVGLIVSGLIFTIINSLCLTITPYLIKGLKLYGLFGLLSVFLTVTLMTLYFIAPETKDKTLLQIECYFETGDCESENEEISRGKEDDLLIS